MKLIRAHSNAAAYADVDAPDTPPAEPPRAPERPIDPRATGYAAGRVTLTIRQAQTRAQVSRRTIYNWMAQGKVEYVRTAGGSVRIFEDTLFRQDDPR